MSSHSDNIDLTNSTPSQDRENSISFPQLDNTETNTQTEENAPDVIAEQTSAPPENETPPNTAEQAYATTTPLSVEENHFPPLVTPALPSPGLMPPRLGHHPSATAAHTTSGSGLQSKPTTAISLPEGVLAHTQDAIDMSSSRATSIAGVPSFSSDSANAPTLDGRGNDVEGMLAEILSMEDEQRGWWTGSECCSLGGDFDDSWTSGSNSDCESIDSGNEDQRIDRWRSRKKHFFVLSSAGKPVYSRYGDEALISGYMGVIQTIVSFFQDAGDPLRSFVAGKHRFCVVREGALYLVAISSLGESDAQLRAQLDALYNQVVSTLTLPALSRVFAQREGFDLRRLLGGTEVFLDGLSDAMVRGDPATLLCALECIKIRKSQRQHLHNILLKSRVPSLLYGLLVADSRLVSVVRPKRHSLHPPDLQLLFSMLFNAATFRDGGEHWTPICLPKFNAKGYLYAYICFFRPEVAIALVSAEKEGFFELRGMKETVVAAMEDVGLVEVVEKAIQGNRYSVTEVIPPPFFSSQSPHLPAPHASSAAAAAVAAAIKSAKLTPPPSHQHHHHNYNYLGKKASGTASVASTSRSLSGNHVSTHASATALDGQRQVWHFLYKSRANVQFTMPAYEPHFYTTAARRRLMTVYQRLHAAVHAKQGGHLKVHYARGDRWSTLAWVTQQWEVYVVGGGTVERQDLAEAAGKVVRWVAKEEERCFVVGGAVF